MVETIQMNVYELPIASEMKLSQKNTRKRVFTPLPLSLLVKYALWFCNFRWVFIAILTTFGILGFFPDIIQYFGLHSHTVWAFITAGILFVLNIGYIKHIMQMKKSETYDRILTNIWIQIVLDLIILTGVIHYVGTLETYLPFAYLFHIVLACIFFSGRQSFIVTIMVCLLYVACVSLERFVSIPSAGIYADRALRSYIEHISFAFTFNILSALSIWLVVWYLASHLSGMVREREYELAKTNQHLKETQKAKTKHLLRITHELKAPFAAIDANIQLLLKGHCGFFPDEALEVMERIVVAGLLDRLEHQEMLQLANLYSVSKDSLNWKDLDLVEIIKWCKAQVKPMAEKRKIIFEEDMETTHVIAVEDHMKMLFMNLLSNAIIYSHERGRVRVQCKPSNEVGPVVTIEDQGIGIPNDKLPKIFDEYYRTDEGVRHNKSSTGLGLAIVHHVAQTHNLLVRVASMPGKGTKVKVRFPYSLWPVCEIPKKEEKCVIY